MRLIGHAGRREKLHASSGQSAQEVVFTGIADPQALKDEVEDYLHERSQSA